MLEDKLLYMYSENNCLPFVILENGQYIFVGDFVDQIRHDNRREILDNSFQIILPIKSILDDTFFVNSDGVIEYRERHCCKCGSKHVIKKDYNWRTLYLEKGIPIKVKIKRYLCRKCGKKSQTEFLGFYAKYSNFSNIIKNKIVNARENS